jgi:hypothetical protein
MTTYLAFDEEGMPDGETLTVRTYCSDKCREDHADEPTEPCSLGHDGCCGHIFTDWTRDDGSYEFDEECANCGKLVPASA